MRWLHRRWACATKFSASEDSADSRMPRQESGSGRDPAPHKLRAGETPGFSPESFTFINYDGIPWNNNNAEHAIKHFADYRNTVAGQIREFGLRNYLMMLSAYQTCEYKGVSFWKFLLSKETGIDKFCLLKKGMRPQDDFGPNYNSDIEKWDRSDSASFL